MPIDPKFIGKEYPAVVYEVGREKVKEYAVATGDLNPYYMNPEEAKKSKYGKTIAMPMFAVVYAAEMIRQVLLDGELSLNLPMLVHGEQEFEFYKVVYPGDVITTTGKIAEIFQKQSKSGRMNDHLIVETISKNQNGEVVCKGRWTFIVRG